MEQPVLPPSKNYGLGYQIIDAGGLRAVGHGGSNSGWQAQFLVIPSTGDGLLVMTNSSIGQEVHRQLFCAWRKATLGQDAPCLKSTAAVIGAVVGRAGSREAVATWRKLKAERPNDYMFGPPHLNILGYFLLMEHRVDDAIAILELNAEAYPEAPGTYEWLGDAYLAKGDTAAAIRNLDKSISLDAKNTSASEKLKRLRP
jgi:predicted Zn-dependent protease